MPRPADGESFYRRTRARSLSLLERIDLTLRRMEGKGSLEAEFEPITEEAVVPPERDE